MKFSPVRNPVTFPGLTTKLRAIEKPGQYREIEIEQHEDFQLAARSVHGTASYLNYKDNTASLLPGQLRVKQNASTRKIRITRVTN